MLSLTQCVGNHAVLASMGGCTDPAFLEPDPYASSDDGSCATAIVGCIYQAASNYDALANVDDNSANLTELAIVIDRDGDGAITTGDLLHSWLLWPNLVDASKAIEMKGGARLPFLSVHSEVTRDFKVVSRHEAAGKPDCPRNMDFDVCLDKNRHSLIGSRTHRAPQDLPLVRVHSGG